MKKIVKKFLSEFSYLTGRYCLPPEFFSLMVTFRCNFRCRSCSVWRKDRRLELTDGEWLKIAADLKKFSGRGAFLEISGGEPLLRKALVLRLIKELKPHFSAIGLNSNGSLIDRHAVAELEEAGLDALKVSLYSLNARIHNWLRGSPSAYGKALGALKLLAQSRIRAEAGVLVTSANIKELPELIENLAALKNVSVILQPLGEGLESAEAKNRQGNRLPAGLWPERADVLNFFGWISGRRRGVKNPPVHLRAVKNYYLDPPSVLGYRCFSGQRGLMVYPDGGVALCFNGRKIGSLKETSAGEVLRSAEAVLERIHIRNCQKYCRVIGCNFSRGFKELIRDKLFYTAEH